MDSQASKQLAQWALSADAVVYDDGAVLVVNKPEGISVSAQDGFDLIRRLRCMANDERMYLCPHVHLDRDVSGVVVFSRDLRGNGHFAQQALARRFRTTFVAAVCVSEQLKRYVGNGCQSGVMHASGRMHRISVLVSGRRGGLLRTGCRGTHRITVEFRVLWTDGITAVVQAESADGPRAIRAVMQGLGSPVLGDTLGDRVVKQRGSVRYPRLMLHAQSIAFEHPFNHKLQIVSASLPWEFKLCKVGQWTLQAVYQTGSDELVREAVLHCSRKRMGFAASENIQGFRLVHGEGEGLEGLDVEWLANHAVLWVKQPITTGCVDSVIAAVELFKPQRIFVKYRPIQASRITPAQAQTLQVGSKHWGEHGTEPCYENGLLLGVEKLHATGDVDNCQHPRSSFLSDELIVSENGLRYVVRPADGLSTGLFLDQREARAWMKKHAQGKRVLNLFSYTCSFSVVAAAGGAASTVSVDISRRSLQFGQRNFELNNLQGPQHQLIGADVGRWLKDQSRLCGKNQKWFDIIVFDPPSFGTSPSGAFVVTKHFSSLVQRCMELLRDQGWLLACTNHRGVSYATVRRWLQQAAREAKVRIRSCDNAKRALDFPCMIGAEPHLKALLCYIEREPESAANCRMPAAAPKSLKDTHQSKKNWDDVGNEGRSQQRARISKNKRRKSKGTSCPRV